MRQKRPEALSRRVATALLAGAALLLVTSTPTRAEVADPSLVVALPPADVEMTATAAELDLLVGPVALYPDSLLAVVLAASVYPLEIVQAARWLEARGGTTTVLPDADWDENVRQLVFFPQALAYMNEHLDWTARLGDAVDSQQEDVMDAVQRFRARADAAGNLTSNEQVTIVHAAPYIRIIEVQPEVVYVPVYEPARVLIRHYEPMPLFTWSLGVRIGSFWLSAHVLDWHHHRIFHHHRPRPVRRVVVRHHVRRPRVVTRPPPWRPDVLRRRVNRPERRPAPRLRRPPPVRPSPRTRAPARPQPRTRVPPRPRQRAAPRPPTRTTPRPRPVIPRQRTTPPGTRRTAPRTPRTPRPTQTRVSPRRRR